MNKYIKIIGVFIGVWFVAAIINGMLSGLSIALLEAGSNANPGTVALSVIFSFVFSVPVVGFVWVVTVIAQSADKTGNELFQLVLRTAFFTACVAAIVFINTLGREFLEARYAVGCSIVVSALAAILLFRNQIKTYE